MGKVGVTVVTIKPVERKKQRDSGFVVEMKLWDGDINKGLGYNKDKNKSSTQITTVFNK